MGKSGLIALLLAALCGPAVAGASVQRLSCTRLSGGPMRAFNVVINDTEKTLSLEPDTWWLSPDRMPDVPPAFEGDTIKWSYMRGVAVLDRKTGILDWDDTDEYAYLENIGQADPADKEENYRGKMQCKILEGH